MTQKTLTDGTEIIVCNAMIDLDGTNLEEGIDVFLEDTEQAGQPGKYLGSLVGLTDESISVTTIEQNFEHLL